MISAATELHEAGMVVGAGTFSCVACGSQVSLEATDELPECPRCGGASYRRASMFDSEGSTTAEFPATETGPAPDWLAEARNEISEPGRYLAFDDDGVQVIPLADGWTRIGRSVKADLRLDDPTVSRRHALIVWEQDEPLRVMDDRSLNGVLLNGRVVDWGTLTDGDELMVGRYRLVVIEA